MKVRDVDLSVRASGSGPAFVWGHGLMGSVDQEDEGGLFPWEALEPQWNVVRYDARGHGRSEATLDPKDYGWRELARDLRALADALGGDPPALGGVSMGCATSLHAAVAAPERTPALVLAGPPTAWKTRPRQARIYRFSAALIERVGLGPFRWLGRLASRGVANGALARMQRSIMDGLRRADPRAVTAALRGAAASDLPAPATLRKLRVPTLILAWPGDPTHPLSTAETLAGLLPNATLHVATSEDDVHAWPGLILEHLKDAFRSTDAPASRAHPPRA